MAKGGWTGGQCGGHSSSGERFLVPETGEVAADRCLEMQDLFRRKGQQIRRWIRCGKEREGC